MAKSEREIIEQLYPGWTVISKTKTGDEFIVDPQNVFSPQMIPNPNREEEWVIVGPNNQGRQTITVRPAPAAARDPAAPEGPQEAAFDVVNVPSANPPSEGAAKPKKGLRRVNPSSGALEEVIDDTGTWSAVLAPDGSIIKATDNEPPKAGAPTTKLVGDTTFQWDPQANEGKGGWVDSGLPKTPAAAADRPPPSATNTTARQIQEWDGEKWVWKTNPNYQEPKPAPRTPEEVRQQGAAATTAEATAAVALPAAETALKQAQANADLAALNLTDAQRKARQAPTDQQAQAAIAAAQRAAELANQQLEQAIAQSGQVNPLLIEQAKVALSRARTAEKQDILGPLVGLRDRIKEIKSLVQSGEISPEQGDMMVSATTRGTTVAEGLTSIGAERTARRQQDLSSRNQMASTFGSMANQGFSTLADMNKYASIGSSAGADAFMGMLNIAQDRLKQYELPAAPETDFLGLGGPRVSGLIGAAQQTVAQPMAATPPAAVSQPVGTQPNTGQPITINIGGGNQQPQQPAAPQPVFDRSAMLNTRSNPADVNAMFSNAAVGPMVSAAAQSVPATVGDIYDAYGLPRPRGGSSSRVM